MSGLRFRKRIRIGPLPIWLNISRSSSSGWSCSWSFRFLGLTRNSRSGRTTVDLPGGFYAQSKGKSRSRKAPAKRKPVPPPDPYRPSHWPWVLLVLLAVLAVLNSAVWQTYVELGTAALFVLLVQLRRSLRARRERNELRPESDQSSEGKGTTEANVVPFPAPLPRRSR